MHKDVKELIREMEGKGWEFRRCGTNHVRLVHPSGQCVVTSSSPSDRRSLLNARAAIRRLERSVA